MIRRIPIFATLIVLAAIATMIALGVRSTLAAQGNIVVLQLGFGVITEIVPSVG